MLDEPTAGVDIEIRRSMWEFLREINAAGTTIILTTHYLEEAESLCRNVAIIDDGIIIEDAPMSLILRKLQKEVIVLTLRDALAAPPRLENFDTSLLGDGELEVTITAGQDLNSLFAALDAQDISIVSLRNKANRLEEFFIGMVEKKKATGASGRA